MNWHTLDSQSQITQILQESHKTPVLVYKHSYRCSIATVAHNRIKNVEGLENLDAYLLDVVKDRPISKELARILDIEHESPQAILLKNGSAVYHASHLGIFPEDLKAILQESQAV